MQLISNFNNTDDISWKQCINDALNNAIELSMAKKVSGVASFFVSLFTCLQKYPLIYGEFIDSPKWESVIDDFCKLIYAEKTCIDDFEKIKSDLINSYNNMRQCLDYINLEKTSESVFDQIIGYIEKYLGAYINLCNTIVSYNIEQQEIFEQDSIRVSLFTGFPYQIIESKMIFRFFSPLIMENFIVIGKLIDEYSLNSIEVGFQKEIYIALIKEKIERLFFINTIIDGEIFITSANRNEKMPYFEKISDRSSIETIEMIRLIEKIDAYMVELKKRELTETNNIIKKSNPIKIVIMGDVDIEGPYGLNCLCELVNQKYPEYMFEFNIYINWMDKNHNLYQKKWELKWESVDEFNLDVCKIPNNLLSIKKYGVYIYKDNQYQLNIISKYMNPSSLKYFGIHMDENSIENENNQFDLIFILDCPSIYRRNVTIREDLPFNLYKEWISDISLKEYFQILPPTLCDISLKPNSNLPIRRITSRYNMLALNEKKEECHFEYSLKEELLETLIYVIKKSRNLNKLKHIYVMISSTHSVKNTKYSKWNIVREEHYRGKGFCLFTLKSPVNRGGPLDLCDGGDEKWRFNKNFICFSLWNVYKHIDLNWLINYDSFVYQLFANSRNSESDLIQLIKKIYIKLKWKYNCKRKEVFYEVGWVSDLDNKNTDSAYIEKKSKDINEFLSFLFGNILDAKNNKGLSECFRNAFMNAFYSRIRCWEDAVNYQMMNIHYDEKYDTKVETKKISKGSEIKYEIQLINNFPSPLLPDRWIIIKALKMLSSPISEINYYGMIRELRDNDIEPEDFFYKTFTVCNESGYGARNLLLYLQLGQIWRKF